MLPTLLLLANLTKTPTNETRVSVFISGMPGPIRNWLKSIVIPLITPIYWATAGEKRGAQNGLNVTKGHFEFTTQLDFKTGETLLIVHRGQGVNDKGVFVLDVDVKGRTPKIPSDADVKFLDFEETFVKTGVGQMSSSSQWVCWGRCYVVFEQPDKHPWTKANPVIEDIF